VRLSTLETGQRRRLIYLILGLFRRGQITTLGKDSCSQPK
jgi:hypothetical protein